MAVIDLVVVIRIVALACMAASIPLAMHISKHFKGTPYSNAIRLLPWIGILGTISLTLRLSGSAAVGARYVAETALIIIGFLFTIQTYLLLRRR